MPKIKRKPFGNPKLDNMKLSLSRQSLLGEQSDSDYIQVITMFETLSELLKHYNIDSNDDSCWLLLSLHLARDYCPGFHHAKKRGKTAGWSWTDDLALYALIELQKKKEPNLPYETIYYDIPELAQGTRLYDLVRNSAQRTIKNRHRKFKASSIFKILKKADPILFSEDKSNIEAVAAMTIYSSPYHQEN